MIYLLMYCFFINLIGHLIANILYLAEHRELIHQISSLAHFLAELWTFRDVRTLTRLTSIPIERSLLLH